MSDERFPGIPRGLNPRQERVKRAFDLIIAVPAMVASAPVLVLAVAIATLDTREWGIFSQLRIGRGGKPFKIHKIRTMRSSNVITTTVTKSSDPRITRTGFVFRKAKIDEIPQFFDVVSGKMSLVGPRPDVPGWADELRGQDAVVLSVRPGITGAASMVFKDEERILENVEDPTEYNATILWPEKVRINREYVENWTLFGDLRILFGTLSSIASRKR